MIAHGMFGLELLEASSKVRTGGPQWFAEAVAAFGLIVTILGGIRFERASVPWLVGLYITAAYWFTASTSFANPAVAIARSTTNNVLKDSSGPSSGVHRSRMSGGSYSARPDDMALTFHLNGSANQS